MWQQPYEITFAALRKCRSMNRRFCGEPRRYAVVLILTMKVCRVETQYLRLLIGDFHASWIGALIQFGLNREAGCRGGMPNQVHNHRLIGQRLTAPVFGNVTTHSMFDFVPFADAWWKVTGLDRQTRLIGQAL